MWRPPIVELLWCDGCPSVERALDELRAALVDVGLIDTDIRVRQIVTDADAHRDGFLGSPTIRVDGVDIVAVDGHESAVLTCRVYRRRDGRFSPTPDPEDLREALRRVSPREHASADA
jgi:hypothetical protein